MKHRKIAFYLALYLFITSTLTGCKKTTKEEIIEDINEVETSNEEALDDTVELDYISKYTIKNPFATSFSIFLDFSLA